MMSAKTASCFFSPNNQKPRTPQDGVLLTSSPHKTNKRHRGNNANPHLPIDFWLFSLEKKSFQIVDRSSVLLSILHSFYISPSSGGGDGIMSNDVHIENDE